MKISPVPSVSNSVSASNPQASQESKVSQMRTLKMNTNATPGNYDYAPPEDEEKPSILPSSESKTTEEVTQPISPQFAALAKQRRAIQLERQLLDKEKAEWASKSQGSDSVPLARLKSEPLSVLLESGVTYDQLTEAILANQGNSDLNALKAEMNALKEGIDKKFVENESRDEQRLYSQVDRDAKDLIATKVKDFELVSKMGRKDVAVEVWKREFKETGNFPDIEDILRDVETQCLKECEEFTKLDKIQALFPQRAPEPQQRQGMRTLTNKDTASIPTSPKARALAAFYGNLKK